MNRMKKLSYCTSDGYWCPLTFNSKQKKMLHYFFLQSKQLKIKKVLRRDIIKGERACEVGKSTWTKTVLLAILSESFAASMSGAPNINRVIVSSALSRLIVYYDRFVWNSIKVTNKISIEIMKHVMRIE